MNEPTPTKAAPDTHAADALGHVVPLGVLLGVFAALMVLTAATVGVSYLDLGSANVLVALGVATVKAALVALFFMHLRYDSGMNAIVFLVGVAMLALFLVITMVDSVQYQPDVQSRQRQMAQ